jgi:hypothetical protein
LHVPRARAVRGGEALVLEQVGVALLAVLQQLALVLELELLELRPLGLGKPVVRDIVDVDAGLFLDGWRSPPCPC